jgi:hypothetical protein
LLLTEIVLFYLSALTYNLLGEINMNKFKIWYYTTVKTEESMESVYENYPDNIEHEGRKRVIKLTKDYIDTVVKDADYGED